MAKQIVKHSYIEWTASSIFGLVAIAHLLRMLNGWDVTIGTFAVPMWLSWAAVILIGYLSLKINPLRKK